MQEIRITKFYTTTEVSELTGIPTIKLQEYARNGVIPVEREAGSFFYYGRDVLNLICKKI